MISTTRLSDLFVEVADTLVDDFDLVDLLHRLTEGAAQVSGADAVGLLLADHHGVLRFMAASNETGEMLELFQLQHAEGPCLDCFTTGLPVVNADLAAPASGGPASPRPPRPPGCGRCTPSRCACASSASAR